MVKLVVPEAETDALAAALERWPDRVSSDIVRAEVHRTLWRGRVPPRIRAHADAVLSRIIFIRTDDTVISRAASFKDPQLNTLDAIHLAAALSMGDDPDAFIVYDARLARAAMKMKLNVWHPGVTKLV